MQRAAAAAHGSGRRAGGRWKAGRRRRQEGRRRLRGSRSRARRSTKRGAAPLRYRAGPGTRQAGRPGQSLQAAGKGERPRPKRGCGAPGTFTGPIFCGPQRGGREGAGPLGVVARGADPPLLVPRAGGAAGRGSMLASGAVRPR